MDLNARQILDKLVSYPSVSRDGTRDLVNWVEAYLQFHGIRHYRMDAGDGINSAIYAHVGPDVAGGVLLSGHLDVVPVDGQSWTTDPFTVTERDGRLFGRGTCDMKGFDALALHAIAAAGQRDLARPLQIALSFDEEIGCLGAPPMIARMQNDMPRAELAIIGEPSLMQVVTGQKGGVIFDVRITGHEVHSSLLYQGVNAIMEGAKLIDWANQVNAANAAARPDRDAAVFDPPYTNAHVGQISGGTAHNIAARDCRFGFGFRNVPTEPLDMWKDRFLSKVAEVEAGMKAIRPDTGITVFETARIPGLRPEPDGAAEALARRLTGDNGTHAVSYGTEAGQFQDAGYSAVICGPGSIEQAHQADEYISVAEFQAGQRFMSDLLDYLEK